jgi:hypothetical protein
MREIRLGSPARFTRKAYPEAPSPRMDLGKAAKMARTTGLQGNPGGLNIIDGR